MNNLILDEYPLIILPQLAVKIGLNEAIVIQQIHYWIGKSNHVKDGKKWVYNSFTNWQKQFPFWSVRTLKTVFKHLENKGLLVTGNYNKAGFDKTKWYRIDYKMLEMITSPSSCNICTTCGQELHNGECKNCTTYTRDYTENTTETNKTIMSSSVEHDCSSADVIKYLNEKAGRKFRNTPANAKLINARINEGFEFKEFKQAIDNKVAQWTNDPKFSNYIRPSTLFRASKFEGYVNEQPKQQGKENEYGGLF